MTPERFRECMDILNLGNHHLTTWLDVDDRRVRRWKDGKREVPPEFAEWLEALMTFWETHPMPDVRGVPRDEAYIYPTTAGPFR
jgi:hypothetical protein